MKQSDLFDTNILKDEDIHGSRPKLKIVRSGKPLEPFVPPIEDDSFHVKIPGTHFMIPTTPISIYDLFNSGSRLDSLKGLCSPNNDEAKSAPKAYALSLEPYPRCPLRTPQGGVYVFNVDAVVKVVNKNVAWDFSQATLNKVSYGPFDGLPSLEVEQL
ncbi:hypothetical protein Cgig2_017970 [Carnegiea gigantea]|uniref:Uncharacterized protein n=1 Tax=Carnegiea gigantea TaxID=171969 RepID=A0A9Q1K959_9CARY|nr:hypothetical protein Cgig2_017970 [Carnegiea gigantea]